MNTPSPLVPQGAVPPKPKSPIYFKILMVLGIHVVVIGGLLLQGCKETPKESANSASANEPVTPANNPAPAPTASTPATTPDATTPAPTTATTTGAGTSALPTTPAQPLPTLPVAPANPVVSTPIIPPVTTPTIAGGHEYVIAQGDTMGAIARKAGISLHALQEANPGVNAKKLHVGQKIQIPAGGGSTTALAANTTGSASMASDAGGASDGSVYVVKPGDTLSKIAKSHGTRFKAIMEINDMKTTSIRVGQKLKMPSATTRLAASDLPAANSPSAQTAAAPAPAIPASTPASTTGVPTAAN